jgi:L-methionine (R)-S-oxide reductase
MDDLAADSDRKPNDRNPEDRKLNDRNPSDRNPSDRDPNDRDPNDRDPDDRDSDHRHPDDKDGDDKRDDGNGGSGKIRGGKPELYDDLASQIDGLLTGETDFIAILANAAAAIYHALPSLNWAGFYLSRGRELVLGPFQGKPACVRIPIGKGVCGTAAQQRRPIVVPDVHEFPGHIACDQASRSELVVPLIHGETLIGVLDLDSPLLARFDANDQAGCEALVAIIVRHLRFAQPV